MNILDKVHMSSLLHMMASSSNIGVIPQIHPNWNNFLNLITFHILKLN